MFVGLWLRETVMNRVTVGNSLRNQLAGLAVPVEVLDESGQPLGHFVPRMSRTLPDDCPYSLSQLDAMLPTRVVDHLLTYGSRWRQSL